MLSAAVGPMLAKAISYQIEKLSKSEHADEQRLAVTLKAIIDSVNYNIDKYEQAEELIERSELRGSHMRSYHGI